MKYGRLTIKKFSHIGKDYIKFFHCLCDCGKEKIASFKYMRLGFTRSCGCLRRERIIKARHRLAIKYEHNGKRKSLSEWEKILGISYQTLAKTRDKESGKLNLKKP